MFQPTQWLQQGHALMAKPTFLFIPMAMQDLANAITTTTPIVRTFAQRASFLPLPVWARSTAKPLAASRARILSKALCEHICKTAGKTAAVHQIPGTKAQWPTFYKLISQPRDICNFLFALPRRPLSRGTLCIIAHQLTTGPVTFKAEITAVNQLSKISRAQLHPK